MMRYGPGSQSWNGPASIACLASSKVWNKQCSLVGNVSAQALQERREHSGDVPTEKDVTAKPSRVLRLGTATFVLKDGSGWKSDQTFLSSSNSCSYAS